MQNFRIALATATLIAVAALGGCRKSNTPAQPTTSAQPATTTQQQATTEQQTQPMTGAPAPAPDAGNCPAGQSLASDGTCQNLTGTPATTNESAIAPSAPAPERAAASTEAPAAAATPPPPVVRAIPTGSRIVIRTKETLDTRNTNDGQGFTGTLVRPVTSGGVTVLSAGDRVIGVVTESKSPGKFKGEGVLRLRVTNVGGRAVQTSSYAAVVKGKGKRTAGFIGGGTGLGAILGGIAGGGKGAAIGALAGAGAGTVGGAVTDNKEVVIPAESVLTFRTLGRGPR